MWGGAGAHLTVPRSEEDAMVDQAELSGDPIMETMTPWGRAGSLRERRLTPGPGTPREAAHRNQRERLMGALVAVCANRGYEATSVADLVEVSGVSRRAFYEHFRDKEDCCLAAIEEIRGAAMTLTTASLELDGTWQERAARGMATLLEQLVALPAAARLCLVEAYAAGPRAVALVDESIAAFKDLMARSFDERPDLRGMPDEMLWAMIEGSRKVIHSRLHRGTEAELPEIAPKLVALGVLFRPPPSPLRRRRARREAAAAEDRLGSTREADPGERIIRATYSVVAEKGYAATTIGDLAEAAQVSLTTFYERFDGKREVFEAALYAGRSRMIGYSMPAYRRARSWPEGIRACTEFVLDYLAGEPEYARLISRDIYAAGPQALGALDKGLGAAQRLIEEGAKLYAPDLDPIWLEGIMSALYAIVCRHTREHGPQTLPEIAPLATYLALVTFIGPEAACEVANGGSLPAEAAPRTAAVPQPAEG